MMLSKRLEAVLGMVKCAGAEANEVTFNCLADIGTDHGLVPIEAVRRELASYAIASDIGEGPIKAARENIARAGLSDCIETIVADGLAGVKQLIQDAKSDASKKVLSPDVIVISGMGGMLMKKILTEGEKVACQAKSLILSPQSDLEDFRKFLSESGYEINCENCVKDEGKYYFVMQVRPTKNRGKTDDSRCDEAQSVNPGTSFNTEFKYGRREHFSKEAQAIREELIRRDLANYKKIAESLKGQQTLAAAARLKEIEKEISDIECILQK